MIPPCSNSKRPAYPFEGLNFTAEEINRLLSDIHNKVNRGEIKDGLSAYEIAVQNGYKGTQTQWLDSLRGAKGDPLMFEDLTEQQVEELQLPAVLAARQVIDKTDKLIQNTEDKTNAVIGNSNKIVSETQTKTQKLIDDTEKNTSKAIANVNVAVQNAEENSKMQWYPSVSEEGDLTWSRNKTETPPSSVNIKGPKGNDGLSGSLDDINIIVVEDLEGGGNEENKSYVLGASVGPDLLKAVKGNTLAINFDSDTGDFYSYTDVDYSVVSEVGMDSNGDLYANFNYES